MNIVIGFKEVVILTLFFTAMALYYDIYNQNHILSFVINHVIALLIALGLAKLINTLYLRFK
jgi:hypothetical protein